MAIVDRNELIKRLTEKLSEDSSDEGISLLEDLTDTFNDETDYKSMYEENDRQWREKYITRFNTDTGTEKDVTQLVIEPEDEVIEEVIDEDENKIGYEDLFEGGEEDKR